MDPNVPQGQAAIGGMDAVREAMARRGISAPVPQLDQVSPAAPSAPGAVPPQAAPQTSAVPSGMGQAPSMGMGRSPMVGAETPEAQIIIKALDSRLKMLGNLGK